MLFFCSFRDEMNMGIDYRLLPTIDAASLLFVDPVCQRTKDNVRFRQD
jgi:hypothetical protein